MLSKISLSISVILLVAVAYLFFKKPSQTPLVDVASGKEVKVAEAFSGEQGPRPVVMAYVNADSLNEQYTYIVEKSDQLEAKMKVAEEKFAKEYNSRKMETEKLMQYYQSNPNMPASEQSAMQNEIMRMESEMEEIRQREMGALQKKEMELQADLQKRVSDFLTAYAQQKGIDYVVQQQSGLQLVLYGNKAYDITAEVIAGLNAEYAKEKETKK